MRVSRAIVKGVWILFLGLVVSLSLVLVGFWIVSTGAHQSQPVISTALAAEPGDATSGQVVYDRRCSPCHGMDGDGNGPVAPYLNPRPRDFTLGLFKLRTTSTGEPPLDTDLIQTVTRGIPGTAMPTWEGTLGDKEIQDVVAYIKTFATDRFDPQYPPEIVEIGRSPDVNAELIDRGQKLYQRVECWKCHGDGGRSDGESAPTLEDDWGFFIRARNLTKGWHYKRGTMLEEVYTRLSTGMDGSPMPSFLDDLPDDDRWALAAYVTSLVRDESDTSQVVLRSKRISGALPTDPDDPRWEESEALDVLLTGQVLAAPRWQNHSVDLLTAKSLYNGEEIAFLLVWDDPHKDTVHRVGREDDEGLDGTYANWEIYGPKAETPERAFPSYRDAVALQLPRSIPQGPRKPHFLWGRANDPVNLWMWKADLQEEGGDASAVDVMLARGHLVDKKETASEEEASLTERMDRLLTSQPAEAQNVWGRGVWKDGTWKVVMKRALDTGDPAATLLEPGALIPVSFQAWDGANGERGLMMSISSWYFLMLETSTPTTVYLYTLLAVFLSIVFEVWLVRRLKRRS